LCSAHYFDVRDGLVAQAWYESGTRFLDVSDPSNIRQVGYWIPAKNVTWSAYYPPTDPTGQIVYRSVVSGGPPLSDWTCLFGRRSQFVAMPMGGRRLYIHADETAGPEVPSPADPRAHLRELFADFGGLVPAVLAALEKVQVARTDEVVLEGWTKGPVLLVGDAAHATAPTLAQGAAMALEDAVVLGEVLKATPHDVPAALRAYEQRRQGRCRQVRESTRERDKTRDVAPAERDPMLRRRGQRIFADQYRGLVEPF
jgi:FAD-dependent urate hydroxylase